MNKFINYLKSEVIMSISMFCAIISIFINPINKEYLSFIDMHTLIILFSLMSVIQIWNKYDVINKISSISLKKVNNEFKFSLSFTLICFFSSMLVTNDVSLITFVPIAIGILKKQKNYRLTISTIVMMTIAANLGSMFTPIGNPQNLYLDLKSQMSLISFFKLMTMLTLISLILIILSIYIFNFRYKK
ncbi:MAG: SLC13 family permease [Tissierellia bacterium]|nr:SLC13 family permease [Tissierellia bacterium]